MMMIMMMTMMMHCSLACCGSACQQDKGGEIAKNRTVCFVERMFTSMLSRYFWGGIKIAHSVWGIMYVLKEA